jgi:hypothetical protein
MPTTAAPPNRAATAANGGGRCRRRRIPPGRCRRRRIPLGRNQALPARCSCAPAQKVLYFAYGANTSSAVLRKRGVSPLSAEPAVAAHAVLAFRHRGGYATLLGAADGPERSSGAAGGAGTYRAPAGVLWELTRADLARLALFEAGYRTERARVVTPGGAEALAVVFVSSGLLTLPRSLPPRRRYRDLLLAGLREHGCAPEYSAWLAGLPVAADGRALGAEYYQTPSEALGQAFLACAACALLACVRARPGRGRK